MIDVSRAKHTPSTGAGGLRYLLIGALSFAQYLALFFFYTTVPAVLRQSGASLTLLSLFALAQLAFTFNFLWAPWVDRSRPLGFANIGRFKGWFILTQGSAALLVGAAGLASPHRDVSALLALTVAVALLAATQRISTAGYTVTALSPRERGWGNAAGGIGAALGLLAGGGGALLIFERSGWHLTVAVVAAVLAIICALALLARDHSTAEAGSQASSGATPARPWAVLKSALLRPEVRTMIRWTVPLAFAKGAAFSLIQPRLVDAGLPLSQVGLLMGAALLCGFLIVGCASGFVVARLSLGATVRLATWFVPICLLLVAVAGTLHLEARAVAAISLVLVVCGFVSLQVVSNTLFMAGARAQTEGTDFSALTAVFAAASIPGAITAGLIGDRFGYSAAFLAAAVIAMLALPSMATLVAGKGKHLASNTPKSPPQRQRP